jgi:hypothetical protein
MASTLEQIQAFNTPWEARVFAVQKMDEGHLVDVRQLSSLKYKVFLDDAIAFASGYCIFTNKELIQAPKAA